MLSGEKILITGPAGQIAFPLAESLARDNDVWGIARFSEAGSREKVDALGVTTRVVDLATPDGSGIPIEEREGAELTARFPARNPAFDVTPARFVTGLITERGVIAANREAIATAFPERATQ